MKVSVRSVRPIGVVALGLWLLASCGGGGGGDAGGNAPPTPSATPNPAINATTSYRYQNVPDPTDIGTLLANNGVTGYYFDSRRSVDLDGDGTEEIVVAAGLDVTTTSPVRVFQRQGDGSYADATAAFFGASIPGQIHPRKTIAADFNGDGKPDLYFVDHGYDHLPFPGAQNVLVLSDSVGTWTQKAIPGALTAFHHCASAGDIDNNGTVDIFVCAEAYQGPDKSPYLLLNDGAGNMTVTRTGVPASLGAGGTGMLAAELVDVDGDGFLDLVACARSDDGITQTFTTRIYWGNGSGSFSDTSATVLPNPSTFVATYDIKAEDVDGDGVRDLVLLRVTGTLAGYYFQILRQTAPRTFADESLARIIVDATAWEGNAAQWFPWIHMPDLGIDGKPDLVIGDGSAIIPSRNFRWMNDGGGNFAKLP